MKKIAIPLLASVFVLFSCSRKQASAPKEKLAWHTQTIVKAYDTVGKRNPKWDGPARKALLEFAEYRAGKADPKSGSASIGGLTQEAVAAGCDDPMVRYLYCRMAPDHAAKSLQARQDDFRKMAQDMEKSSYAPMLKFYANDRTANVLWENRDHALWHEITQFRRTAMNDLAAALEDKSTPGEEVGAACEKLLETISANEQEMDDAYPQLEGPLFRNFPDLSVAYFIKGKFYYRFAWRARGNGFANQVTEEGWKGFKQALDTAEVAYRKAWDLNSKDARIPTEMIEMAVSQQKDRAEMELWFTRGLQLDNNNYAACLGKLRYLEPKWNGSREEMLAFGRECVASKWGGRVPITLVEAHYRCVQELDRQARAAYWRQPDVWPDVQAAYEKFFAVNPGVGVRDRYHYAQYAFYCGQWQDFNSQIKLIRDFQGTVDEDFFGGEAAFKKMVEAAKVGN